MKAISNTLFDYFVIRVLIDRKEDIQIKYISPSNKLKTLNLLFNTTYLQTLLNDISKVSSTYLKTKKTAIFVTKYLLQQYLFDKNGLITLENSKKKDDLCDTFLQAYFFISSF